MSSSTTLSGSESFTRLRTNTKSEKSRNAPTVSRAAVLLLSCMGTVSSNVGSVLLSDLRYTRTRRHLDDFGVGSTICGFGRDCCVLGGGVRTDTGVAPQPQPPCGDQHAQYGEVTDESRTETSLTAAARVSERPCPRSPCAAEARRSTLEALRTKVP